MHVSLKLRFFLNHHKLMSLEMQSHFPSSPAEEESEGGSRQDWEEGKAGREMGRGRSGSGGWPQTQVLACPTGLGSYHQLPPPVLQAYQTVTNHPTPLLENLACAKTPEHLDDSTSSILCRHLGCAQLPLLLAQPQPQSLLGRCSRACTDP